MNFGFPQVGIAEFIAGMETEPATLVTWTKEMDAGQVVLNPRGKVNWIETQQQISVIQSYQTSTKVPVKINSEVGQYRSFDYEFFTTDVLNLEVSTVEKPPELIFRGRRHRIHETETVPLGVMRMVCEQLRTGNV